MCGSFNASKKEQKFFHIINTWVLWTILDTNRAFQSYRINRKNLIRERYFAYKLSVNMRVWRNSAFQIFHKSYPNFSRRFDLIPVSLLIHFFYPHSLGLSSNSIYFTIETAHTHTLLVLLKRIVLQLSREDVISHLLKAAVSFPR